MCLREFCLHVKLPGRVHLSTKIQDSESKTRLQNPNPKTESKIKLPKFSKVVLLSATLFSCPKNRWCLVKLYFSVQLYFLKKRRYSQRLSSASFAPKTSVALHLNFQNPKPQSPSKSMQSSAHMQKFGGTPKRHWKKKRQKFCLLHPPLWITVINTINNI